MAKYRVFRTKDEFIDVEADNFEMSPTGLLFTTNVQSMNPLDPVEKNAFSGLFRDFFGFYAIDDEGNRINLIR